MAPIDVLIPLILAPTVVSPLMVVYYIQYTRYQRHTPYLFLVFLTMFIASILAGLGNVFDQNPFAGGPLSLTAELAALFIPFFFYMHFQSMVSIRPPAKRFSLIFGLTILAIALHSPQYFGFLYRLNPDYKFYYIFVGVIQTIQACLTLYFSVLIAYRNYDKSKTASTRYEFLAMVLILISFVGIGIEMIVDNVVLGIEISETTTFLILIWAIIPSVLGIVGFLLFLINYFRNLDYLYSIPIEIHSIIFYNTYGVPLFQKQIETDSRSSEVLLSGAFTAISAVLQESLDDDAQLTHIDLGLYNVFFGNLEDVGTLALICDEGSSFFTSSINRFIAQIPDSLHQLLQKDDGKVDEDLYEEMDQHLLTMFPFLKNRASRKIESP